MFSADMTLFLLSSRPSHPGHLRTLSAGNRRPRMSGSEVWRELRFHVISPVSVAIVFRRQEILPSLGVLARVKSAADYNCCVTTDSDSECARLNLMIFVVSSVLPQEIPNNALNCASSFTHIFHQMHHSQLFTSYTI